MTAPTAHDCPLRPLAPLPRGTAAVAGVGGRARVEVEDFEVEELPLYTPSGKGDHLYLWVEKRDLAGPMLRRLLAQHLQVAQADIGMAGLKDRRAVTRQWVSVPASTTVDPLTVQDARYRVLHCTPHGNKLRTGHLAGNRFVLRLRGVHGDAAALRAAIAAKVALLRNVGMPNFYGEQRMGHGGSTLAAGWALAKGLDGKVAVRTPEGVVHQVPLRDRTLRRLAASALQSELFNRVVARRMRDGTLATVLPGDVCRKTDTGGSFTSDDPAREAERLSRGEVEITAPMWGPKMMRAADAALAVESEVLEEFGMGEADFRRLGSLAPGTRRAMAIRIPDLEATLDGSTLTLAFSLPSGSFATVLLHELMGPHDDVDRLARDDGGDAADGTDNGEPADPDGASADEAPCA